jgi:acyl-CoA synthetase (AMP-forming)/AMP-acid ligase II
MRLHDLLDYHAREKPEAEFALQGERCVSYREAFTEANRLANALVEAGLQVGDRIAYLAKNSLDYMILFFGASKAGVVPVPLNYRLAPPEWSYIINDAGARLLIAKGELVEAIDTVRDELGGLKRWIALDCSDQPQGWDDYREWMARQPTTPPDRSVSSDDDGYQMYTSGTTGRPKGAVLTHHAVTTNAVQLLLGVRSGLGEDRCLIVAPLYHGAAALTAFGCILNGGCLVVHQDFDPTAVVRALSEGGITRTTLVPAMIQACLVLVPDVAERRYDDLELIVYGASPIAEQTLRRAMEVFRCDFIQGYGMTETSAALTLLSADAHKQALQGATKLLLSAGRPLVGTEVRVVDADDRPVPHGVIGEVVGRGPQLMRGYWNLPEASAAALRGGWIHTGDAGIIDDEGYLYLQDRVKDMIVSGGENIYPREVEEVLFRHPAVADAAVIGVPDETFGEAVKAIVVLRESAAATSDEIMDFCKTQLGGYKRPRSVDFVAELPRNPSGKVLKRELREPYWKGRKRRIS